jgi:hypothetical protein
VAGVAYRRAVFWSQALVSQSAPRAAGRVPPMTQPKKRPDCMPIRPGSAPRASSSRTAAVPVGPDGSGPPNTLASSSAVERGAIGRSPVPVSHSRAWAAAVSTAVAYSFMTVSMQHDRVRIRWTRNVLDRPGAARG